MPAKPLEAATISAPGFRGLNTQDSGVQLDSGFAIEAYNCIIDSFGRIGTRRGWTLRSSVSEALLPANKDVTCIHEFQRADGIIEYISTANNKVFKGFPTMTEITPAGYTITNENWQATSLNNELWLFARGQEPLVYFNPGTGFELRRVSNHPNFSAPPGGYPQANTVIGAYGRLWMADTPTNTQTVWFSDLLEGNRLNSGTAGSLNVAQVWPDGVDNIVALAAHNGFLIIFGKRTTLIYANAQNPAQLTLQDAITNIGCVARDSIQYTGTDVIFLSQSGVRSLNRLIQEKSLPLRDLSKNVRDDLLNLYAGENFEQIKSVYFERDAFYLITVPSVNQAWCFDMRATMEDGSARVTLWDQFPHSSFCATRDNKLLLGTTGGIGEYFGYTDNGSSYEVRFRSTFFDMGAPTLTKIMKKVGFLVIAAQNQPFTIRYGYDYSDSLLGYITVLDGDTPAQFNINEYGIGEYSGGIFLTDNRANLGGGGKVYQLGFDAPINGSFISLQRIDVFFKQGRTI